MLARMDLPLRHSRVRPLRLADAASIAVHANDHDVWRNLRDRVPFPYLQADAECFITSVQALQPPSMFAIEVDGAAVGVIGFEPRQDVERLTAEIGFWLGRMYWGRGIMSEAVRAVTQLAFDQYRLVRVDAGVFEWNPASMRVLEKAGYVREGVRRKGAIKAGRIIDLVIYASVRSES